MENYVKKLIGYAWERFKVEEVVEKKPESDDEIELDVIKKIRCRWIRMEVLRC